MPILITCQCGKRLRAKDEAAGKQLKCPFCGKALAIPPSPDQAVLEWLNDGGPRHADAVSVGRPSDPAREEALDRVASAGLLQPRAPSGHATKVAQVADTSKADKSRTEPEVLAARCPITLPSNRPSLVGRIPDPWRPVILWSLAICIPIIVAFAGYLFWPTWDKWAVAAARNAANLEEVGNHHEAMKIYKQIVAEYGDATSHGYHAFQAYETAQQRAVAIEKLLEERQRAEEAARLAAEKARIEAEKARLAAKKAEEERRLQRASVSGQYTDLLSTVHRPEDKKRYGEFKDYGWFSGALSSDPPGYWVYLYPDWYVWKRDFEAEAKSHREEQRREQERREQKDIRPARPVANIGDLARIEAEGTSKVLAATDLESWRGVFKHYDAKDDIGVASYILRGRVVLLDVGTQVRVVDAGGVLYSMRQIRVLEGEHFGKLLWTAYEFVVPEP